MSDFDLLKPVYDELQKAGEGKQLIMDEMKAAFAEGTDEGKEKAMALRSKLDEAQTKEDELTTLYQSLLKASKPNKTAAQNFVQTTGNDPAEAGAAKSEMERADFFALDTAEQMKFIRAGGQVVDPA